MDQENGKQSTDIIHKIDESIIVEIKKFTQNTSAVFSNLLKEINYDFSSMTDVFEATTPAGVVYIGDIYSLLCIQRYLLTQSYPMPMEIIKANYTTDLNGDCILSINF